MAAAVVTGASGFVGRALGALLPGHVPLSLAGADWRERLRATDFRGAAVFHLGARAHAFDRPAGAHGDHAEKTLELARAAARAGASAFVYLSTIKVNGEETPRDGAFGPRDAPQPQDDYARGKWQAELALAEVGGGLAVHVVRAPLVQGRGVKGNLRALLRLCDSSAPLPFASIDNRRSFVGVDDLARLLRDCAAAGGGGRRLWLAAHPVPVSTPALVAAIRSALGRPPRLFGVPARVLELAASAAGRGERARKLTRSLVVDAGATERELGWRARSGLEECARAMVAGWRAEMPTR